MYHTKQKLIVIFKLFMNIVYGSEIVIDNETQFHYLFSRAGYPLCPFTIAPYKYIRHGDNIKSLEGLKLGNGVGIGRLRQVPILTNVKLDDLYKVKIHFHTDDISIEVVGYFEVDLSDTRSTVSDVIRNIGIGMLKDSRFEEALADRPRMMIFEIK